MKCSDMAGAVAYIKGDGRNPQLNGSVRFLPHRDGCLVVAQISGFPEMKPNFLGFHIHEGSSCAGTEFSESKGHYNPGGNPHPMHVGDLPPLLNAGGTAFLSVVTNRFCVAEIIGKTVVIHENPDDFTSQPAGNAGSKIACGIIRKM